MALAPSGKHDPAAFSLPWSEMFQSAALLGPKQSGDGDTGEPPKNPRPVKEGKPAAADITGLWLEPDTWLALYIAMAHAGLATALLVLYGLYLLLADFLRPLQWALLCSVLLRETQRTLVAFWEPPLRAGLSAAVLALPLAALCSSAATLADARAARSRASCAGSPPPSSSSSSSTSSAVQPRCSSSSSRSPSAPPPPSSPVPHPPASPAAAAAPPCAAASSRGASSVRARRRSLTTRAPAITL
jgi:hypothetical protein